MKSLTLSKRHKNITLAAVFTTAGVLYCLISLVNHYLFKTYALDLGLYTHAMYEYAHFSMPDCGMFKYNPQSILSDHFDLYLVILSPLIFVFGSYTLLIVQIAAVLLGGWGVYKLIGLYTNDDWMPVLASAAFLFSFGIIHALSYDYHSNVLTAMMLPWLLYFLKRRRFGLSTLFVVLFVIGKENMSLWLFFIALGLMWDYRKDKQALWHLAAYAMFSIAYFFIVNMIVMPKLGGSGGGFARYAYLGDNYAEMAKHLLKHPAEAFRLLYVNHSGFARYDGVKMEFYTCVLASGLLLTLLKPNYLIMLIPLIGQKMLAIDGRFWGITYQYSVEFMPVLVISSFLVIIKLKNRWLRWALGWTLLLSVVLTTFYTIGVPKTHILVDQLCVYQGRHYEQKDFDAEYARQLINQIPAEASVCASTMFVPHLALRHEIYDFYAVGDSVQPDYVLVLGPYLGLTRGDHNLFYWKDKYEIVDTDGMVFLFRKKQP